MPVKEMFNVCVAILALLCMSLIVAYLEMCLEKKNIDASRAAIFENLDPTCLKFLRKTKERPIWRLSWLSAIFVALFTSTLYCMAPMQGLGICSFLLLSFISAFLGGYSVLSYYTWHILCPNYDCSKSCEG